MSTYQAPTRSDVEKLKSDWLDDPCWDIYDTEGYEAYYDELKAFQEGRDARVALAEQRRLSDLANKLGIPGNIALAKYMDALTSRISRLEDGVNELGQGVRQ
jgi:polyhydroxyalkanoate synthesis regulator phasin